MKIGSMSTHKSAIHSFSIRFCMNFVASSPDLSKREWNGLRALKGFQVDPRNVYACTIWLNLLHLPTQLPTSQRFFKA